MENSLPLQEDGSNLIFVISQPRSGSTLLQALIGKHSRIKTIPEPWLLLPLLSIQRENTYTADYDDVTAQKAIKAFIAHLPDQQKTFQDGLRKMVLHLYGQMMTEGEHAYFLDKTPRYYFVISEIRQLFPNALIILLLRNPLAVLCSMITRHKTKSWLKLGRLKHDLFTALQMINRAKIQDTQALTLHYEEYVASPQTLIPIFNRLNLPPPDDVTTYKVDEILEDKGFMGDKNIEKFTGIQNNSIDKWIETLDDPQMWRLCQSYLDLLGRELINGLGYNYDNLQEILNQHRPNFISRLFTLPIDWFFNYENADKARWHPRYILFFGFRSFVLRLSNRNDP